MKKLSILATSMALLIGINSAHAQNCAKQKTTPDSRFEELKDGIVKDTQTGLIWQRCSIGQTWMNGQCTGDAENLSWHNALSKAKEYGDGWRLPNIRELYSIVEFSCNNPAINTKMFPIISDGSMALWSSTPSQYKFEVFGFVEDNMVNILHFKLGDIAAISPKLNKSDPNYALAVKSSK